jgi:hypothetical protein
LSDVTDLVWAKLGEHLDNPIVFMLVLASIAYLFVSKRLAELSGPLKALGGLSRWWNDRQVKKIQRQRELWKATHDSEREREDAEMAQMRADLAYLNRELTDMKRRERLRDAQARAHTDWDNEVVRKLQGAGIPVGDPPPPLYLDLAPLHIPEDIR